MKSLNYHITSSQIGISMTTLGVGFITVGYFYTQLIASLGDAFFIRLLAVVLTFTLVGLFHSVFGEIIPKILAYQNVENIALKIAPVLYYINFALYPFTKGYRLIAGFLLKVMGISQLNKVYSRVYTEDELKLIIAQSQEEGEIDESEEILINRVLDFTDTRVNAIFTPRYEIVAFEKNTPVHEIIEKAKETGYSRFPIFDEKLDQIMGFVHVKDLLIAEHDNPEFSIDTVMRRVFIIHEAMRLDLLLKKMQKDRSQVAIVVDEYGSVEGLVTIEDILEAIVGPIDDEFDIRSVELVKKAGRNDFIVDGRVTLDVFNQAFQCELIADDSVTIAGFILEHLESVPEEGSRVVHSGKYADFEFIVEKMDGNRVDRAKVVLKRKPSLEIDNSKDNSN